MNELVTNKDVLHFALEPQISGKLRSAARTYAPADFHREDVDRNLDITRMSSVDQKSFDLVVACDVLEHVNDLAALVRQVDSTSFRDDVVKRCILASPKLSSHPLTTNYHKIFSVAKR
jgi:Methyltransferase domain